MYETCKKQCERDHFVDLCSRLYTNSIAIGYSYPLDDPPGQALPLPAPSSIDYALVWVWLDCCNRCKVKDSYKHTMHTIFFGHERIIFSTWSYYIILPLIVHVDHTSSVIDPIISTISRIQYLHIYTKDWISGPLTVVGWSLQPVNTLEEVLDLPFFSRFFHPIQGFPNKDFRGKRHGANLFGKASEKTQHLCDIVLMMSWMLMQCLWSAVVLASGFFHCFFKKKGTSSKHHFSKQ